MNVFVMMERKKKIICRFGSLCRVLHSAKDPFAERNGQNTRQSWQNGRPENRFSSFAECCDSNTRQRNLKKNLNFAECLPCWHSAKSLKKKSLPSAWSGGTRQRKFPKKIKALCRVSSGLTLGKEFFKKKIKIFAECLEIWHSAKKIFKKNKSSLPSACRVDARQIIFLKKIKNLCRVPGGLALGKENFQKKK